MPTQSLTERYHEQLDGVLHCYDRIILLGSLHPFCSAKGMTGYLYEHHIRIFDYAQFAERLREQILQQAERLAQEHGPIIDFIRQKNFRKEVRILGTRLKHVMGPVRKAQSAIAAARPCRHLRRAEDPSSARSPPEPAVTLGACFPRDESGARSWLANIGRRVRCRGTVH